MIPLRSLRSHGDKVTWGLVVKTQNMLADAKQRAGPRARTALPPYKERNAYRRSQKRLNAIMDLKLAAGGP
jgi:hypothetical protein